MITFNDCLLEYQRTTGVVVSHKKAKLISYKIKTIWDKKGNPPPSYVDISKNGRTMTVRQYPDKFKPTILGVIQKRLKVKRKRVRKTVKKPVFSYKPKNQLIIP